MMKLKNLLVEDNVVDPKELAKPFFKEFSRQMKTTPKFSYLGLKNKEHIFNASIEDLGTLKLIFSNFQKVSGM